MDATVRGGSFTRMTECRYCFPFKFKYFPVFAASRFEVAQIISRDHMHNFTEVLVFSHKFKVPCLFGFTMTCIMLTNCTHNLLGTPGSTFPFW